MQAIILAPSRELVNQIGSVASSLFQDTTYKVTTLIGGANVRNQIKQLRDTRPQILVATPGRLAELVFRLEKIRLGNVRAVVVDEIDNMLQEPYIGELQTILEATALFNRVTTVAGSTSTPTTTTSDNDDDDDLIDIIDDYAEEEEGEEERIKRGGGRGEEEEDKFISSGSSSITGSSTSITGSSSSSIEHKTSITATTSTEPHIYNKRLVCLASATGNDPKVALFADKYCPSGWKRISVPSATALPTTITHGLISSPRMRALEMLKRFLLAKPTVERALIFVNDPHRVEVVCEKLLEMGLIAAPLHGDSSKDDRKVMIK